MWMLCISCGSEMLDCHVGSNLLDPFEANVLHNVVTSSYKLVYNPPLTIDVYQKHYI